MFNFVNNQVDPCFGRMGLDWQKLCQDNLPFPLMNEPPAHKHGCANCQSAYFYFFQSLKSIFLFLNPKSEVNLNLIPALFHHKKQNVRTFFIYSVWNLHILYLINLKSGHISTPGRLRRSADMTYASSPACTPNIFSNSKLSHVINFDTFQTRLN